MSAGTERICKALMTAVLTLLLLSSIIPASALDTETISRRDLVITMGDGWTTEAQLTFPAVGSGPFPGVLLIPGGGAPDMDEYMSPYSTETGEAARPHLQIAEYLSERGFAVMRYNKRGVGFNGTLADLGVFLNTTIQDLERDAETALEVLRQQIEVDADDITLIGHSESTIIAPRVAAGNPSVQNIVLMGTAGRSYYDIKYHKTVDLRVTLAEEVLDTDRDGLLSALEVFEGLGEGPMALISAADLIENSTGKLLFRSHWNPDGDESMNITGEFKATLIRIFDYAMVAEYSGSKLVQSQLALESTMETIGGVSSNILILHGANDLMTPLEDALLLEQTLTENSHPDHTLITYPGLGHYFYPEDYWRIVLGPTQDYVLRDLEAWLKDPARKVRSLGSKLQSAENVIEELWGQLGELNSEQDRHNEKLENQISGLQIESADIKQTVTELKLQNVKLQTALLSARNMTYIAIGVALITGIAGVLRAVIGKTRPL
jgi:pimeloyl-ACP methyl ester carboxylesterase